MNEKSDLSRRDVLRTAGSASAAALGGTSVATGKELTATNDDREKALKSEYVETLLKEVGNPEIIDTEKQSVEAAGAEVEVIILKTAVGEVLYSETGDGQSSAQFRLVDLEENPSARRHLPIKYRNVPKTSDVLLTFDVNEGLVFLREATDREAKRLARATGVDPDDSAMFYNSLVDGFEVHSRGNPDKHVSTESTANLEAFIVGANERQQPDQNDVTNITPGADGPETMGGCSEWCFNCAGAISWCGGCLMACASIPLTTIGGIAACAACVISGCAVGVPYVCKKCADAC